MKTKSIKGVLLSTLIIVSLMALALSSSSAGPAPALSENPTPHYIYLTWATPDTAHTINVSWRTDENYVGEVRYDNHSHGGDPGAYSHSAVGTGGLTTPTLTGYIHHVGLTGLEPDTIYYFICGNSSYGWSGEQSFRTAPDQRTSFRFATGGDSRDDNSTNYHAYWPSARDNVSKEMAKHDPSFVLFVGDYIWSGQVNGGPGYAQNDTWDNWLGAAFKYWRTDDNRLIPIIPAIGNHEIVYPYPSNYNPTTEAYNYYTVFNLPGNERWYALSWGPDLRIIVLDSEVLDESSNTWQEQLNWLKSELENSENYLWKVVAFHRPILSSTSWWKSRVDNWGYLFTKYGVDVAFQGHIHYYDRTYPIDSDPPPLERIAPPWEGVTYVVSGGWGAPLGYGGPWWYTAHGPESRYHFTLIDVFENRWLHLQAIDRYGTVFDEFSIYIPHVPVYINGNDNFIPANGVVEGSGTENDPYIIEGWDISAENAHGIEIRNTTAYFSIRNCYVYDGRVNSHVGIRFENVRNGGVENVRTWNNLSGIYLYDSENNSISNNIVENNNEGTVILDSDNNKLGNNDLSNNTYNFNVWGSQISHFHQDIDNSNTVNGKPIYYMVERENLIFDGSVMDIGFLGLVSSENILVRNLNMSNNSQGILLADTSYSTIINSTFGNNAYAIDVWGSSNNTFTNCTVENNTCGAYFGYSSDNNLISNNIFGNNDYGISLARGSDNNLVFNNLVRNNRHGIYLLLDSNNNRIYHNNIVNNHVFVDNYVKSSPSYEWTTRISTTDVANGDDVGTWVTLPFGFPFWGEPKTRTYICSNGFLIFDPSESINWTYGNLEALKERWMIAPFWCDLRTDVAGGIVSDPGVYVDNYTDNVVITWEVTRYGSSSDSIKFQVILYSNGDVRINIDNATNFWNFYPTLGISRGDNILYFDITNERGTDKTWLFSLPPISAQAYDNGFNYWDDGYLSGGNYWSDYTGVDENKGENQDIAGSDGIGDTLYNIPGDSNRDRYPLMGPPVEFRLVAGWQILGFQLTNSNMTPANLFAGVGYTMKYYVAPYGPFKFAPPDKAVELGRGYLLKLDNDKTVTVIGIPPENYTMDLIAGWQIVSFPVTSENTTPEKLFAGVGYTMKYYVMPYGPFKFALPGKPVELGVGYLLKLDNDKTITVPL